MKVNITGNEVRNGYLNVIHGAVLTPPNAENVSEDTQIVVGRLNDLDPVVPDGAAEEILFNYALNILGPSDMVPVLEHWRNKLKEDGTLKVSFIDIKRLGRFITSGELSLEELDTIIYGPNHSHLCLMDTNTLSNVLKNIGFRIDTIAPKDFFVTVEAKKDA